MKQRRTSILDNIPQKKKRNFTEETLNAHDRYSRMYDANKEHKLLKYVPLIRRFINALAENRNEVVEDLYQVGLMTIDKALNKFDASRGVKELTFLYKTVWREIARYHYKNNVYELSVPIRAAEMKLEGIPTCISLADIDVECIEEQNDDSVEDVNHREQLKDVINQLLGYLTEKQKLVIEYTYGLNGKEVLRGKKLEERMGVKTQVRSHLMRGQKKIKKYLDNWNMKLGDLIYE